MSNSLQADLTKVGVCADGRPVVSNPHVLHILISRSILQHSPLPESVGLVVCIPCRDSVSFDIIRKYLKSSPTYGKAVLLRSGRGSDRTCDTLQNSFGYVPLDVGLADRGGCSKHVSQGLYVHQRHEICGRENGNVMILHCRAQDDRRSVFMVLGYLGDVKLHSFCNDVYSAHAFMLQASCVGNLQHFIVSIVPAGPAQFPNDLVVLESEYRGLGKLERKLINLCKLDIIAALSNAAQGRVLDVGCGRGSDLMKYYLSGVRLCTLIDSDPDAIAICARSVERNSKILVDCDYKTAGVDL